MKQNKYVMIVASGKPSLPTPPGKRRVDVCIIMPRAFSQRHIAYRANEAVTMPLGVKCDDGLIDNGFAAAGTAGGELIRVASRAVGATGLEL